jgi:hypothetical protein
MSPPLFLGLTSAIIATFCFGTFAVPVKSPACRSINSGAGIHPLAFQSYKTLCCLLTSWLALVIPAYDEDTGGWVRVRPVITAWGLVSGLFWVPGGVAAIYAVQNAGLAVAQGTWSTLIVLVSFIWGIFIFGEEVKSIPLTMLSSFIMISGLIGMSVYGVPTPDSSLPNSKYSPLSDSEDPISSDPRLDSILNSSPGLLPPPTKPSGRSSRFKGLAAAVFNGVWGGSIMVPMHYAPPSAQGLGYVISFAIGATTVTLLLWIAVAARWRFFRGPPVPRLHWRVMWKEGLLAGSLWR